MRLTPISRNQISVFAAALLSVVVVSCGGSAADDLAAAADKSSENGTTFSFDSVARGNWTRVLVVQPYAKPSDVERRLGFRWEGADGVVPDANEADVMVFASDDKVIETLAARVNVTCLAFEKGFSRDAGPMRAFKYDGATIVVPASGKVNAKTCEVSTSVIERHLD